MQFDAYLAIQNHDFIKKKTRMNSIMFADVFKKWESDPFFVFLLSFAHFQLIMDYIKPMILTGNNATACGCFVMLLMDHTLWTWKGKTGARLVWFFYRTLVDVTNRNFSNDQRFLQLGGCGGKANGWCGQLSRSTSWKVSRWWWNEKL